MISESSFYVGKWLVECELNRISYAGNEKTLVPKVMKLLQLLASDTVRSFSQDELMKVLWPDLVVSDSSVYQAIAQLRKALEDSATNPRYIERVSGKGYRLIAKVEIHSQNLVVGKRSWKSRLLPVYTILALTAFSFIGWLSLEGDEKIETIFVTERL